MHVSFKSHSPVRTMAIPVWKTSALDAETYALGAAILAFACSFWRYRCGVSSDFSVGTTPQMCNRVTNLGDMCTFSRPVWNTYKTHLKFVFQEQSYCSCHSGWSLALDHFCGNIGDPCSVIANLCGVIANSCSVIADPCVIVVIPEG